MQNLVKIDQLQNQAKYGINFIPYSCERQKIHFDQVQKKPYGKFPMVLERIYGP